MEQKIETANGLRMFTKAWIEERIRLQVERSNPSLENTEVVETKIEELDKSLRNYFAKYEKIIKDLKKG